MLNFIMQNWVLILIVLFFVVALVFLWYSGKKPVVKKILFALVCRAEQAFGSGTGAAKLGYVFNKFYKEMPFIIRLLIPESTILKWIEEGVQQLKHELSNGMNLLTYKQEKELELFELGDNETFYRIE